LPGVARRHERLTDLVEAAQPPAEAPEVPRASEAAPSNAAQTTNVEEAQKAAG
jgi:hypothetical protein